MFKNNKDNDNKSFIIQNIFLSSILAIFVVMFICVLLIKGYPNKSELIYENCTFIRYEYEKNIGTHGSSKKCLIYVNEYETPLEIDNIVVNEINANVLNSIKSGDEIVVSIQYDHDKYNLYSMAYKERFVLSYDDYLTRHTKNNRIGIVVTSIMIAITASLLIFGIIYYKKTGKIIMLL